MRHSLFVIVLALLVSIGCFSQQRDSLHFQPVLTRDQLGRELLIPVSLIAAGVLTNGHSPESFKNEIEEERNKYLLHFKTHIDNYLQYSPIVICYTLDALGIKAKTDPVNRTAVLFKGELLALGTTYLLKNWTHQLRPDKTTNNSFPSGHSAQVFAAATMLSEEYKDRFKWMPYASYGLASTVGFMRIANNRHYISDVLLGAGLGILSMKASYWTHHYHWNKHR